MIKELLDRNGGFVIFGAQVIAYGAYEAIKGLTGRKPDAFVVSNLDNNPKEIDGIVVKEIDSIDKSALIIVGVTELVQKEVVPFLEQNGYKNIFVLNQHEEHNLMSAYYDSIGKFPCAESGRDVVVNDFAIYEVKNHRDKKLTGHPKLKSWEKDIQAGRASASEKIAEYVDNIGENISEKNHQYCEMTATYWVWKNTSHDWCGIEHYRRHLLVTPEMLDDDIDAILPLPYICYPNEATQFLRFVNEDVLELLIETLKVLHPNEFQSYYNIIYGKYQYTYNLVCAKREVFNDYCKWFFEITEYMEQHAEKVPEIKETRALSYVAEVLTNIYFMSKQDELVIRHVGKEIYI